MDNCPLNPPSRSVGDVPDKPDRPPLVFGHLGVSCQSNDHEGVLSDAGDLLPAYTAPVHMDTGQLDAGLCKLLLIA